VTLLVAGCELSDLAAVGDGKHLRFRVAERGRPSGTAIAFGFGRQIDRLRRDGAWDIAFRLEENRWNGTVSPQLVVRQVFETPERYSELRQRFVAEWGSKEFSAEWQAIFEELGLEDGASWRSLLESERFRALLAQPALAKAA
jgi:RecJ OB domain